MFSREHQAIILAAAERIPPRDRARWFKDLSDVLRPLLAPTADDVHKAIEFATARHGCGDVAADLRHALGEAY